MNTNLIWITDGLRVCFNQEGIVSELAKVVTHLNTFSN